MQEEDRKHRYMGDDGDISLSCGMKRIVVATYKELKEENGLQEYL